LGGKRVTRLDEPRAQGFSPHLNLDRGHKKPRLRLNAVGRVLFFICFMELQK
jgi:hypothetical protein